MFTFIRAWSKSKLHRDVHGQGTAEYALLILGAVLFLLVAAFAVQDVLNDPVSKVSSWIGGQDPP